MVLMSPDLNTHTLSTGISRQLPRSALGHREAAALGSPHPGSGASQAAANHALDPFTAAQGADRRMGMVMSRGRMGTQGGGMGRHGEGSQWYSGDH